MLEIITYVVTGEIYEITYIIVILQSMQAVLCYVHERVWERIAWDYFANDAGND